MLGWGLLYFGSHTSHGMHCRDFIPNQLQLPFSKNVRIDDIFLKSCINLRLFKFMGTVIVCVKYELEVEEPFLGWGRQMLWVH